VFVGAPLLALAAVRPPSRRSLGVIGALASLALIAGRGGWPAWLGAPELHLGALAVVLAVHAGAGLEALATGQRRAVLSLAVAAGCAAIALGALGAQRAKHPDAAPAIERALLDGGLGLICMIVVILLVWRAPGRAISIVLALIVLPGVGAMPSLSPVIARTVVDDAPPWARAAESTRSPARVFRPAFMHEHAESLEEAIATFAGASGWRWGIAAARSTDPARLVAHDRVWLAAAREGGALLDRFGIALAILPETLLVPRKLTELGRRGAWALTVLPVAPAAAVLRGSRWAVDPADATDLLFAAGGGTNVLRGTVVLRGAGEARVDTGPPLPCTIDDWSAGAIDVTCAHEVAGHAVISSSTHPGWSVNVGGAPRTRLTADVLRRAVAIDAGRQTISWRYATPGGTLGAVLAVLGALAIALIAVFAMFARRRTAVHVDGAGGG
jgi:hypothetical protein